MDINFYFLGNRSYVNGLTIFEEMLKTCCLSYGVDFLSISKIRTFKINRFVRNNSWIELYRSAEIRKNPKIREAAARIDFLRASDQFSILLFEKQDPVKARLKDIDRGQYLSRLEHFPDGSSIAEIINFSDIFGLMRGIVEANFRFVNEKAAQRDKQARASWAYLTDFDFLNMAKVPPKITAHFKFVTDYEAYEKHFIIRTLNFEKFQEDAVSEICFFI